MIESAEQRLSRFGVKPTPQRVVILEYLMGTEDHPTADQVMAAVEDKLPVKMSRATVYNTLNTLHEAGVIDEIAIEAGRVRYDANLEKHHHFVNKADGRIYDLPHEVVNAISFQLDKPFKMEAYQVTFYGQVAT